MENMDFNRNSNVNQAEQMLYNAITMTEMAMDIKEQCKMADKHLSNLRNSMLHAYKSLNSVVRENENFLSLAHKLTLTVAYLTNSNNCEYSKKYNNIKYETDKLLTILEKELADIDETVTTDLNSNDATLHRITEKLKRLETRQRQSYVKTFTRTCRESDVDEKYPEMRLKGSFLDLNSAVRLPSVPEYMSVDNGSVKKRPVYSVKNYRRIKLVLQRAESNSDEENDESGSEGQNSSHVTLSDYEEKESNDDRHSSSTKTNTTLDDIEEEDETDL